MTRLTHALRTRPRVKHSIISTHAPENTVRP